MSDTEIAGLIMLTILAAIVIGGLAVDAWNSWQDRQRHKRLLHHLQRRHERRWWRMEG